MRSGCRMEQERTKTRWWRCRASEAGFAAGSSIRRRVGSLGSGFTMVELLVVIVVIGVLIAIVAGVSGRVMNYQKRAATMTLIRSLQTAIDDFAAKNPLKTIYDGNAQKSFGPYPPYQLASPTPPPGNPGNAVGDPTKNNTVRGALEPQSMIAGIADRDGDGTFSIGDRLYRDIVGNTALSGTRVRIAANDRDNDDIRALYTYLKVFVPDSLARIDNRYFKRLTNQPDTDWIVTTSHDAALNEHARTDILGIVDAWGVPLDYFMYVKLEYAKDASGNPRVFVRERIPVIRSRGVDRETYEVRRTAKQAIGNPSSDWILSMDFPSPPADAGHDPSSGNDHFWREGEFDGDSSANGWARAVALWESYGYVPWPDRDR